MSEDLDDDSKEQLDQMVKAAKAAEELSALMLSAGGTVRPELRMLNLGDIMPMAEAKLRAPCESAGVPFQLNMQPSLPSIQGDNSRLSEILIELVRNAAEAAQGTGGEVAIDVVGPGVVDPQSRAVEVFVRNTGAAINREKIKELKDMFRPFVTTKVGNHSGLGLTNCAMLAGKMGMRLGVKAEGDTVTLWLSCPVAS
ncbi:MAG: HAMP domain-containing sensor histidine kinase [Verrucomicrobiales bacterium]